MHVRITNGTELWTAEYKRGVKIDRNNVSFLHMATIVIIMLQ